ncbi:MAG: flagellar filament capping protein FliD [Desulfuromonadaceae bacterium]|nr:flagellar filament capping protein FliD [Desulfuromonadaceae bacterium]
MADITFSGLATGMDTDSIVKQMMEIERRPIARLEKQKESEATRLKAFKQFDDRLKNLREAVGSMNVTSEVRQSSINVSATAPFTATSNGAGSGSYDIAVVQLAQVQKNVASGVSSSTDAILGHGTFRIGETTINVDESNNSLLGLQEAINAVADKTGVRASIINDGSGSAPYRLVLTGQDATANFEIDAQLDGEELGFEMVRPAQQAIVQIDGIEITSASNTLSGVLPGVELHLNSVSDVISVEGAESPEYRTSLMGIQPDTTALKAKVQNFVDSYNAVMDWISAGYEEFGASRPSAAEVEDGQEEILSDYVRGDSGINGVKRQLQSLLSTQVNTSGEFSVLSQLGIATQRDGSLTLNESTLDKALETKFDDVVSLLAGSGSEPGVMKHFNSALLKVTGVSSGLYADKKESYDSALKKLDNQIDRMEMLTEKREATMRAQFNSLELLVSQMNSQSNFLTQQMEFMSTMLTGGKK